MVWMLLLFPALFVFCSNSKFQCQTFKAGKKSRLFKALLLFATLLSCVSFSECYYIYTFAGTGSAGYQGDGEPATSAKLYEPYGVAVSSTGEVYIADYWNNVIRVVFTNGTITTFAGNGTQGYYGDRGPATSAELWNPHGVAVSSTGEVYIADSGNNVIRVVYTNGTINTFAGNGTQGYYGDRGPATDAELDYPRGIAVSSTNEVFIGDTNNNVVRIVYTNGIINTFAGNGFGAGSLNNGGYSGDGESATTAELNSPIGVSVSSNGDIYIADWGNNRIRIVYTNGTINTFAGNGNAGYYGDGGPATSAELYHPIGLAVSTTGEVYIADTWNSVIRVVVNSSSAECSNQGYYQNLNYCICSNGVMNSCSSCYGINSGYSSICSGHGQCVSPNNCSCDSGYTGYECQLISCYGINQTSPNVCSGHGQCISPNNCSCDSGYTGYNCQLNICYGINQVSSNVCSGRGECVSPNNCSCDSGYTGYECQLSICYGVNETSSDVCSGHGTCTSFNNCNCTNGFTGENCQHVSFAVKLVVNFMFLSLIIAHLIL
jgi:hypothetical protein